MKSLTKQQLRDIVEARKRPRSKRLGELPGPLTAQLVHFFRSNRHNDVLARALESRTQLGYSVEDAAYLSENYGQIELQHLERDADPNDKKRYLRPANRYLVNSLEARLGRIYKTRLAALQPGSRIDRHVDGPDDLRVIAVLEGRHQFRVLTRQATI